MSLWNVGAQSVAPSQEDTTAATSRSARYPRWQTILFWVAILALFAIAIGMRLYDLGLPFDRDSYDEGVYWQSLRAMSAGHPLYSEIFYSQPPLFLLITFPSYVLFGGTLESARIGIALVSLFGLLGATLLGKALSGRLGATFALLLVVVNPLYLQQSQTIQAEVSCVAFSLLAVGLASLWWEHPSGWRGIVLAGLAGMTLSFSVLCKLFGVAALAPLALLILTHLWRIWKRPVKNVVLSDKHVILSGAKDLSPASAQILSGAKDDKPGVPTRFASILPILVGIGASILTVVLVLLPFAGSPNALLQSVIFYHTAAGTVASSSQQGNITIIEHALYSVLTLAALYGTLAAFVRRDWRVLPLLAWLGVTIFLLWRQVPLFGHHLLILTAPLIALAVMGIGDTHVLDTSALYALKAFLPRAGTRHPAPLRTTPAPTANYTTWCTILAIVLILGTAVLNVREDRQYYRIEETRSLYGVPQQQAGPLVQRAAADLRQAIAPNQLVVTDAQFVAALADRSTPPSLVDTSAVRILDGALQLSQLIDTTSQPQVHAVLFFTGRLQSPRVAGFHDWVAHHFHLLHNYGGGIELWVR